MTPHIVTTIATFNIKVLSLRKMPITTSTVGGQKSSINSWLNVVHPGKSETQLGRSLILFECRWPPGLTPHFARWQLRLEAGAFSLSLKFRHA